MIIKKVLLFCVIFGLGYFLMPQSLTEDYCDISMIRFSQESARKMQISSINFINKFVSLYRSKKSNWMPENDFNSTIFNQKLVELIDKFTQVNETILAHQQINHTQIVYKIKHINPDYTVKGWPRNAPLSPEEYMNFSNPNTAILKLKSKIIQEESLDNPEILIMVQSAPKNYGLRQEVRNSYGQRCKAKYSNWCHLIFIIGKLSDISDPIQNSLTEENKQFDDLIQEPFIDSYNNLTIKTLYILKYFNFNFNKNPANKFLLKCDDDSYVHLESLWALAKSRMLKNSTDLIGFLQLGSYKHHYMPYAHKPTKQNLENGRLAKWIIPGESF